MIKRIFTFQVILLSTIFTAYTMSTERIFPLTEQEKNIKAPPGYKPEDIIGYEYTLISDVFINYKTNTIVAWVKFSPCNAENLIITLSITKNIITGDFNKRTYQELRTSTLVWNFRSLSKKRYPEVEEILRRKISEFERDIKNQEASK